MNSGHWLKSGASAPGSGADELAFRKMHARAALPESTSALSSGVHSGFTSGFTSGFASGMLGLPSSMLESFASESAVRHAGG